MTDKPEVRPTPTQWTAIRELDKHLSVSAGAGAGKTWVLTERYTAMLAGRPLVKPPLALEELEAARPAGEPARPAQIVAITFTKEAAGEMKARIRERLSKWKAEAPVEQQRDINLLKEEVERATITTIHGYCSELLREYPVEAGIDPHFAVMEESEARFLLEEAMGEALDAGLAQSDEAVVRLVTEYGYRPLVEQMVSFYPRIREHTEDFQQEVALPTVEKLQELQAQLPDQAEQLYTLLTRIVHTDLSDLDTSKGAAKKALALQHLWPNLSEKWQVWKASGYTYDAYWPEVLQDLRAGWPGNPGKAFPDVKPMKQLAELVASLLLPDGLGIAVQDVCHLLAQVHRLYTTRKQQARALDFTDLQNLAVRLLAQPGVQERQRERLRFLMVDEFQDTNPVQKKLLDALAEGNDDLRLFVVGDAKQSIYRFRGADLEVFLQTQDQVQADGGEHLSLAHNFRTQTPIIAFVNRLFAALMPQQADGPRYATRYEEMEATRTAAHEQPMVEILHLQPQEDAAQSKLQEANSIAARIAQMVGREALVPTGEGTLRPVEYRDITLLFSAMTHVSMYEHTLQQAGIPYYIIGSRHFFRRQEVIDVVMLLQALVEERDVLPLIGALRSPLFGVSDEAFYRLGKEGLLSTDRTDTLNWPRLSPEDQHKLLRAETLFRKWRKEKAYKPAADLLATILADTGYEQALLLTFGGTQKAGNVRKLLELAYDQPAERQGVVPFLQLLLRMIDEGVDEEDAQVESDNSNVVKIMTVHKSKGLEFPVVILPDMARQFNTSSDGKFQYDPDFGLAVLFDENEEWNKLGLTPLVKEADKNKAKEEERRKLYVAMTRARDYLLLVGTREEPKQKMSLDASRWFDWLVAAMADGVLSQMEGHILTAWPEVKWTVGEQVVEAYEAERQAAGESEPSQEQQAILDWEQVVEIAAAQEMSWVNSHGAFTGSGTETPIAFESESASVHESAWEQGAEAVVSATSITAHEPSTDLSLAKRAALPLLAPLQPSTQPGEGKGVLLSVSALLTYLTCPRQYLYRYEWKLPERPHEDGGEEEGAQLTLFTDPFELEEKEVTALEREERDPAHDATERGTLVHRVLEWLHDPADADALIRRALAERKIVGAEAERWLPILRQDVATYAGSDLFQQVRTASDERSEMMFRLAFGAHQVTGVIDKVIRHADGTATVIDYKTNRLRQGDAPALKRAVRHYTPQLQLYSLVVQRLLGWDIDRSVLYFTALDHEAEVATTEQALQERELAIQAALDHIARYDEVEAYPIAKDEYPCRNCGYYSLCKG
ncbi:MAG TPA: UvrD-helicase domain-containing protein [Bacilli bacterium]|nr:UvrD-helicase domain-containing protein [Bacilli bacterium]